MKHILMILVVSLGYSCFSQEQNSTSVSGLVYKPEIPDTSTYEIVRNDSNEEIEESVLLQINFHRRHQEDFLWTVREGLEIRIYSMLTINQ